MENRENTRVFKYLFVFKPVCRARGRAVRRSGGRVCVRLSVFKQLHRFAL